MKGIYLAWYAFGDNITYVKVVALSRKQAGYFFGRWLSKIVGSVDDLAPLPECVGSAPDFAPLGAVYGENGI